MSIVQKQVNVCSEVDTLLGVIITVVSDVKAGKAPGQVVGDVVPNLVAALTGLGELKIELADKKDLEATVALRLAELVSLLGG